MVKKCFTCNWIILFVNLSFKDFSAELSANSTDDLLM